MRIGHLEAFAPVCPACRVRGDGAHPITLGEVFEARGGHVLQGMLRCSHEACQREYPIIDGVPLLLAQIRDQLSGQALGVLMRDDLDPALESLIGDCCGPGSEYDTVRRHLSHYAVDHWGEFDPEPWTGSGAVVRLLDQVAEMAAPEPGLAVDLGCSVGRSSFELAERTGGLVVGIDLNLSMLRLASRALRMGRVVYPRRRVGVAFDRRDHPVHPPASDQVDFWAADVAALPFRDHSIQTALSLNLIDCLPDPYDHLKTLGRVLAPGGLGLLATPYDWSPGATRIQGWIGGHSQRGEDQGDPVARIRNLLTPEASGLTLAHERDGLTWEVRSYERSRTVYSCHAVAVRGTPAD